MLRGNGDLGLQQVYIYCRVFVFVFRHLIQEVPCLGTHGDRNHLLNPSWRFVWFGLQPESGLEHNYWMSCPGDMELHLADLIQPNTTCTIMAFLVSVHSLGLLSIPAAFER